MLINKAYLDPKNRTKINVVFNSKKEMPSITLFDFWDKEAYHQLQREVKRQAYIPNTNPLIHSYATAQLPPSLKKVLNSKELLTFLIVLTGKKVLAVSGELFLLTWKDYTLLHDSRQEKPGFDLILDFTEDWDENAAGHIHYVDGSGDYTKIPIKENMLVVVQRKKGVQEFVQYCNHHAQGKSRYVMMGRVEFR